MTEAQRITESMDCWTADGEKVIFGNYNGYDHERQRANKILKEGQEYTVESMDVGTCSSTVQLVEFPGHSFNSVMFYNAQPEYKTRDWWHEAREELYRALENS